MMVSFRKTTELSPKIFTLKEWQEFSVTTDTVVDIDDAIAVRFTGEPRVIIQRCIAPFFNIHVDKQAEFYYTSSTERIPEEKDGNPIGVTSKYKPGVVHRINLRTALTENGVVTVRVRIDKH